MKVEVRVFVTDFINDWYEHLRNTLIGYGVEVPDELVGEKLALAFFSGRHRGIEVRPRTVLMAKEVVCPQEDLPGFAALLEKIERGADLNPHLTTGAFNLERIDLLLNDWNIHHLHLGAVPHEKFPRFVKRTNHVAFVLFTEKEARVIGIHPHTPPPWSKVELMELLHRNWPEFMEPYRVKGVTGDVLTDKQRANLRKVHVNAPLALDDGDAFMPPGGAITTAGIRVLDVRDADYYEARVKDLERLFQDQVVKLAAENDVTLPTPIVATMKVEGEEVFVYVPGENGRRLRVGMGKLRPVPVETPDRQ